MENKYIEKFCGFVPQETSNVVSIKTGEAEHAAGNTEDVISALGVINAMTLLPPFMNGMETEEDEDEVLEFCHWFYERYEGNKEVWGQIEYEWPEVPRIFRIWQSIVEDREGEYMEECADALSKTQKKDAKKLTDMLWAVRAERIVTAMTAVGPISRHFEKNIPKELLRDGWHCLHGMVCACIIGNGTMFVSIKRKKQKEEVAGFQFLPMKIRPVPVDEMPGSLQEGSGWVHTAGDKDITYVCLDPGKTAVGKKKPYSAVK